MEQFDLEKIYYCPICREKSDELIVLEVDEEDSSAKWWDGITPPKLIPVKPWIRAECSRYARGHVFKLHEISQGDYRWLYIGEDMAEYDKRAFAIIFEDE